MSKLFKSKLFVGVMIVTVMVVGFAAFHDTAAASDCSITTTLRVGSTGAEVSCLQTLVGVTADGKFGAKTKAAVMTWQASKGLVADGVFGAKSRAVYATGGSTTTTTTTTTSSALCPNGNTLASNCTTAPGSTSPALCPNGNTVASNCATAPGTGVSSTGEGSITVTYNATPANDLAVQKGETKDVMTFKVKATGSDMKVSRFWADISAVTPTTTCTPACNGRIWLSANEMALYDGSTLLQSVPLSSSTVVETTIGSQWQVQFNGLNVVVPAGETKYITMKVTRPTLTSANDKLNLLATSSFRATDSAGFTNTYTVSARLINLTGSTTATTGTLTATLNASSPTTQSVSGLSTTAGTLTSVKLMDLDLKAVDGPINASKIQGTAYSSGTVANDIASVELRDGTNVLASSSLTAGAYEFSSLSIDIPAGTTKTLSVYAKVNHIADSNVVKGDGIYATVTSVTATTNNFASTATWTGTVTSNTMYLFQYAPTFALGTVSAVQADESTSTTVYKGANFSISFTVTAPSGSDIYVDTPNSVAQVAYNAATAGTSKTSDSYGAALVTSSTVSGVTSKGAVLTTYDKVAAGTSRTFTFTGYVSHGTANGFVGMHINGIKWTEVDHATSPHAPFSQTWGLSDFKTPSVYVTI